MLTITVSGPSASGKTTLAIALRGFLRSHGFADVRVDDGDINLGSALEELQPERMRAISARTVSIVTSSQAYALRPVSIVREGDSVILPTDAHRVDSARHVPHASKAEHLDCDPPLPIEQATLRNVLVEVRELAAPIVDSPADDAAAQRLIRLQPVRPSAGETKRFILPPNQAPVPGTYRVQVDGMLYTLVVRHPPRGPEGGALRCPCVLTCDGQVGP